MILTHNSHKNPGDTLPSSPNHRWRNSSTEGSHNLPKVTGVSREFTLCCDLWPLETCKLVHVMSLGISNVEISVDWKSCERHEHKRVWKGPWVSDLSNIRREASRAALCAKGTIGKSEATNRLIWLFTPGHWRKSNTISAKMRSAGKQSPWPIC